MCNQCGVVCPVKIPLPDLQRKLREQAVRARPAAVVRARGVQAAGRGSRARPRALRRRDAHRRARAARRWAAATALDPPPAVRRRLDRRPRHAGAGRAHVSRAVSHERAVADGSIVDERAARRQPLPQAVAPRRNRSAPRTPSSCSPRSTRSSARARTSSRFCIGQPDFPTPANVQDAAIARDPRRQARLHAVGRHRRAARGGGARHGRARAASTIRARRRRRRRGREAVHRLHDRLGHRLRRGRRGDLPGARASRSTSRRSSPTARCRCRSTCARRATSRSIRPSSRRRSRRRRRLLILNTPHNPTGGMLRPRRSRRDRRDPAPPSAGLGVRRRDLFAARLRRRVRLARDACPACSSARSSATAHRRPGR